MSLLELLLTDIQENIYIFCTYQVLVTIKMINKNHYLSVKQSKNAISITNKVKNYLHDTSNNNKQIINYIDSLGRFREQIMDFEVFLQYYKHEYENSHSSISYFLFFYYREFNINIQNCAYPCLYCNKFNFIDHNDITLLCQVCNCYNYNLSCGKQTVKSNFQKKFFIEYSVVTDLNLV